MSALNARGGRIRSRPAADWKLNRVVPRRVPRHGYKDPHAAIEFLTTALGFTATAVHEHDGTVAHAELAQAGGHIMIGSTGQGDTRLDRTAGNGCVYVALEDGEVEAHYETARANGAEIERELQDTGYGSREYSARDPEGNRWSFGTYAPDGTR
jgi:uncharacterized glyoxalase superfamily protein PhnB